jgi:hypothetical protein
VSDYVKMSSRPENAAHAIIRDARSGNPDLATVVEMHTVSMHRAEMLSVMRLQFIELANALAT